MFHALLAVVVSGRKAYAVAWGNLSEWYRKIH